MNFTVTLSARKCWKEGFYTQRQFLGLGRATKGDFTRRGYFYVFLGRVGKGGFTPRDDVWGWGEQDKSILHIIEVISRATVCCIRGHYT